MKRIIDTLLVAACFLGWTTNAATFAWDGGGADSLLTNALNWVGDMVPLIANGDDGSIGAVTLKGGTALGPMKLVLTGTTWVQEGMSGPARDTDLQEGTSVTFNGGSFSTRNTWWKGGANGDHYTVNGLTVNLSGEFRLIMSPSVVWNAGTATCTLFTDQANGTLHFDLVDGTISAATFTLNGSSTINFTGAKTGRLMVRNTDFTSTFRGYITNGNIRLDGKIATLSDFANTYNGTNTILSAQAGSFPPVVTLPATNTFLVGQTLTLSASVSGSPPLACQWYTNGVALAGATTNPIVYPNIQLSQAGLWSVLVTNLYGSASATTTVVVVSGPAPTNAAPVVGDAAFSVSEGSAIGLVVGTVSATDPDGDALSYALIGGNAGNAFAINGVTGVITVAGALDYETTNRYLLTVQVTDAGTPPLSDQAAVTINLNHVPEGPPSLVLENGFLSRSLSTNGGVLSTVQLVNKRNQKTLVPEACEEFRLRLSTGVDSSAPDLLLTASDFTVLATTSIQAGTRVVLTNANYQLLVLVDYTLLPGKNYGHKQLSLQSAQPWTLELIDIESIAFADAYNPYQARDMMWVDAKFLPALGQPLYTSVSATFWGVEFPAAWDRLEGHTIRCGYQRGLELVPGQTYTTHRAVFGVGDDPEFIKDTFLEYLEEIRFSPYRLHVQYNTWFDFGASITEAKVIESLTTLCRELVTNRGCRPLDVYVLDDGWQNSRPPRSPLDDWSTGLYKVNTLVFSDTNLYTIRQTIEAKGSKMGLWASPACLFGANTNCAILETNGFDVLSGVDTDKAKTIRAMSLVGESYMMLLEQRMLELVDLGSVYFKFDGFFGDTGTRYFETRPGRGTPVMPSLLPADIDAVDLRLNEPQFDEMKRYYLTLATERVCQIFDRMHARNPEVRILAHNGATISPWWLMHSDVLSLVNSRDGADGAGRRDQMCYRDGLYYQLLAGDGNQVPLNCFFNHEPAKHGDPLNRYGDATNDGFRDYLFLALSRGTGLVELYTWPRTLTPEQFDVIAEGLKWLYHVEPAFKRARLHGGNPVGSFISAESPLSLKNVDLDSQAEVYGYTGWTTNQGFVSIHNPTTNSQSYSFTLDRRFGLSPGSGPFRLLFPMANRTKQLKDTWAYGETVTFELEAKEVIVLDFDPILRINEIIRESSGGTCKIVWQGPPGFTCRVERKADLGDSTWEDISGPITVISVENHLFTDFSPLPGKAFYRLASPP